MLIFALFCVSFGGEREKERDDMLHSDNTKYSVWIITCTTSYILVCHLNLIAFIPAQNGGRHDVTGVKALAVSKFEIQKLDIHVQHLYQESNFALYRRTGSSDFSDFPVIIVMVQ